MKDFRSQILRSFCFESSGGYEITRLKGAKVLVVSDIGEVRRMIEATES